MSEKTKAGRRQFLKTAAVAGGAATVAVAAKGALADSAPTTRTDDVETAAHKGYHVTPHIETYYRLARD